MALRAGFRPIVEFRRGCLAISVLWLASSIILANATPEGCPASAARIYVDGAGAVTINGRPVSVADLSESANAQGEPPAEVMAVIKAIMTLQVPVSFYTDKTFKTRAK
jgi:hypothetical protein